MLFRAISSATDYEWESRNRHTWKSVSWLRKQAIFRAQLMYANWKMIDFSVWSLCHTEIKSVWLSLRVAMVVAAAAECVYESNRAQSSRIYYSIQLELLHTHSTK